MLYVQAGFLRRDFYVDHEGRTVFELFVTRTHCLPSGLVVQSGCYCCMADADTARLCVQIVHSQFGPLAAVSPATGWPSRSCAE